ncbi:MAG: hypothetical protein ABR543_12660 [Gemmatimonadaceae bacterium]
MYELGASSTPDIFRSVVFATLLFLSAIMSLGGNDVVAALTSTATRSPGPVAVRAQRARAGRNVGERAGVE